MSNYSAEILLERVAATGDEALAGQLLKEFFRGLPVARLRVLLNSENESAVKAGAWIASELASGVSVLLPDLAQLLDHPAKYVRFFALDAILGAAQVDAGRAVGKAVSLLDDPEPSVRWKATDFLARASVDQLREALPFVLREIGENLRWLVSLSEHTDAHESILSRLESTAALQRRFAVAAAARFRDREALVAATQGSDSEAADFAYGALRRV